MRRVLSLLLMMCVTGAFAATELSVSYSSKPVSNYAPSPVTVDAAALATAFGITESAVSSAITNTINFYGVNVDGTVTEGYTANTGFWYNTDGDVCSWGAGAAMFIEFGSGTTFNVGQYPGAFTGGETYAIKFKLTDGTNEVLVTLNAEIQSTGELVISETKELPLVVYFDDVQSDYTSISVTYDAAEVATFFGISETELQSGFDFYAVEGTTGKLNATTTANGYGHWFDANGDVCTYGSGNAVLYSEYSATSYTFNVGQYPNICELGSSYTLKQALVFTTDGVTKQATFVLNVQVGEPVEPEPKDSTVVIPEGEPMYLTCSGDLQIDESTYSYVKLYPDADMLSAYFGMSTDDLESAIAGTIKFYGVSTDGSFTTSYSANTGYWYDVNDNVCTWGATDSRMFVEYNNDLGFRCGQYPGKNAIGDQFDLKTVLISGADSAFITFHVNILETVLDDNVIPDYCKTFATPVVFEQLDATKTVEINAAEVADFIGISAKELKSNFLFYAIDGSTDKLNNEITAEGYGQWFDKNGDVCASGTTTAKVCSEYNPETYTFTLTLNSGACASGDTYVVKQALIYTIDGIVKEAAFQFNIQVGDAPVSKINVINPQYSVDEGTLQSSNFISVAAGSKVTFAPELVRNDGLTTAGTWSWKGAVNYKASTQNITLDNVTADDGGTYVVTFKNSSNASVTKNFYLTVHEEEVGAEYTWPSYTPTLHYNFRSEYPDLDMPTKNLTGDVSGVAGEQSLDWWTVKWGKKAKSLLSEAAYTPMLEFFNQEFAYFRDNMGWPPDYRVQQGYRSAIYVYGSGLSCDNADSTDLGGWQSATYYQGKSWPMVLASYYPIYSYDPSCTYSDKESQTNAMIHEGIHAVLASLPGAKDAAWFQEGGNTWLQQQASAERSNNFSSVGFLNGCAFLAPFMPIECYSGWLQDGSFGGPSAEGVNRYDGSQQICTWRNYLGGNQYGNGFPTYLGEIIGVESVCWIWRYCPGRVLEGISDSLGDIQTRRLIAQYRANQAVMDIGRWSSAFDACLSGYWKTTVTAEWEPSWLPVDDWKATCYAKTFDDGNGLLTPEYRTTPGWSGANQIPFHVEGDVVSVNFQPIGSNMSCQLCYRTKSGETVFSYPVYCGDCVLNIPADKQPANGVVFAVIANTDYVYEGETTRKTHFDYRLQMGKGIVCKADIYEKWYQYKNSITDNSALYTGIDEEAVSMPAFNAQVTPNPVNQGEAITIVLDEDNTAQLSIYNMNGVEQLHAIVSGTTSVVLPSIMGKGVYLVALSTNKGKENFKLIVK